MRHLPLLVLLAALFTACTDGVMVPQAPPDLVVEAYLYAGRPVDGVRLSLPVSLDDDALAGTPVSDARVWIYNNGKPHELIVADSAGGTYRYPHDDLRLSPGDRLRLKITFRNRELSAETQVPPAPRQVRLSADTVLLSRPDLEGPATLEVEWSSVNGAYFSVRVRNIDKAPLPLPNRISGGGEPASIASPPFAGQRYSLPVENVTHSGLHLIQVYSLNREYARAFLNSTAPDQRVAILNGNISNGLGIFTAITPGDSLFFTVR